MKTATPATAAHPAITSTIGVLSDRELLRQTSALVHHERHLQGAIIDHLAEIEARGLYLQRGCSSLFDYAVRELGYSDAAAGRRIGAVRLCADQPGARERLRDGSLTLSAAAELQWAFDRQRRRGSIAGTASIAPTGSAPASGAARSAPAEPAPTSAPSQTRREETDRRNAAGTKPAAATTPTPKPRASGRAIPAGVRRHVWQRDGGRCSYVDRRTGRRCNSRHLIEIDHILPYALGGGADPGNLRLLCAAHHRHRHAPHG